MSKLSFNFLFNFGITKRKYLFVFLIISAFSNFLPPTVEAHQQPTTIVLLDVNADQVMMELQIPLSELELAFGHDVTQNTDSLVERIELPLKDYLLAHIHPVTANQAWSVEVTDMKPGEAEQTQSGYYQEITVHLKLLPPKGFSVRKFTLNYDVIMHQVVSHKALVGLRNDWETGKTDAQPVTLGYIGVDTQTTQIFPLEINLAKGGLWQGFKGMVRLGMQHIREGTDHLLFLFVLLLPATLLVKNNRWGNFGGTKFSLQRLLKVITAFTFGHSITLLIGAFGWLRLPSQPVEILIAFSILVSAAHAFRPMFPGKESFVAAGFGLVHGLAFASVLSELHLHTEAMALSILGFNLGIELMQLFIIALIIPWFILLNLTPYYQYVRIFGAMLATVAAVAWLAERISGQSNAVGNIIQNITQYAHLGILGLALLALSAFGLEAIKNKKIPVGTGH